MSDFISLLDPVGSLRGSRIEEDMDLSYFITRARMRCVAELDGTFRIHDLLVGLELELLQFGIEIGVTIFYLCEPDKEPCAGWFVDCSYHTLYGFHAIFISADGDSTKNRIVNNTSSAWLKLIN